MRPTILLATLAAAVCAAVAAPPGIALAEQTAQETIDQLQSEGYTVNIDRIGSARLDSCLVTSVRNPQTQTRPVRDYYGGRDENGNRKYRIIQVVVSKSISVSLDCSN